MSAFRTFQKAIARGVKHADAATLAAKVDENNYIKLSDVKATTLNGGASAAGVQTRTLNTEDIDAGNYCTLAGNQFTLLAGTYRILSSSPAYSCGSHKTILYNVSDTVNEILGSSEYSSSAAGYAHTRSFIAGEFTITTAKTFRIDHYTQSVKTGNGLGVATSDGTSEIYTIVELWKVK